MASDDVKPHNYLPRTSSELREHDQYIIDSEKARAMREDGNAHHDITPDNHRYLSDEKPPQLTEVQRFSSSDEEKGGRRSIPLEEDNTVRTQNHTTFYYKYRVFFHIAFWIIATGWWTAGLGL